MTTKKKQQAKRKKSEWLGFVFQVCTACWQTRTHGGLRTTTREAACELGRSTLLNLFRIMRSYSILYPKRLGGGFVVLIKSIIRDPLVSESL